MSVQATQDASDMASTQVSLAEFIQGSACDLGEATEPDEGRPEIAKRDDTRDDLDYSQTVIVCEHGEHYHAVQYGSICACPHIHGEKVALEEAVKQGYLPCSVCQPVEYRRKAASQATDRSQAGGKA